jgi:hypothetical protein
VSNTEFFGATVAVLVGMLGNTFVMLVYLGGRIDRLGDRIDRLADRMGELDIAVNRIGQRLDDHINDPMAHNH